MKRKLEVIGIAILLIVLAVLCADGTSPGGTTPGILRTNVTLVWDPYPTNQLTPDTLIKIYSSTNVSLPMTNWPVITNVSGTNVSVSFPIDAQQRWFVATASNWWGESDFSNVASTPPLPRSDLNLRLGP